jgi:2-methylcitrate dehydratase PrpD
MADQSTSQILARFAVDSDLAKIPADVLEIAKKTLLDTFACIIYGQTTTPGGIMKASAPTFGAGGACSVAGLPEGFSPLAAALANGTMAHSFEMDDRNTESMFHASSSVVGAAMATAELRQSSGADLLRAFVLGHEVASRVANAVIPESYEYGWHSQGWHPTFGAAAAASILLGSDAEQTTNALGLAATSAGGLIECAFSSDAKPFHAGKAAMAGVVAAQVASLGYTGGVNALDGSDRARGYFALLAENPHADEAMATLGKEWKVASRNGLKPHACAGDMHPGIDGVLKIMDREGLTYGDVSHVEIHAFRIVPSHFNIPQPRVKIEALMSYQHAIAAALYFHRAGPREYMPEAIDDPQVAALRDIVSLHIDPEIDARFPKYYGARVVMRTARGDFTDTEVQPLGDPEHPMSQADVERKTHDLLDDLVGASVADGLIGAASDVERLADVSAFTRALRSPLLAQA